MYADYHLHSSCSNDSQTPMEDMVQRAVSLGLDEICFTEHTDYGIENLQNCDYDAYFSVITEMQRKYRGQIVIRAGIEFGVQIETIPQYESVYQKYPFDFVLCSFHQIDNKEFWRGDFQKRRTQEEYQTAYYQYIYDVILQYKFYSVLGHLDVIKRYDPCGDYPDEKILLIAEKIMRQAIADEKGIEINTSTLRYGMPGIFPSRRLLELYYDLGGKILTIGSDSHDTKHMADLIPETQKMLKEIGFQEICTFQHLEPVFHKL